MEAEVFSLSAGGHCSTEEETCFKKDMPENNDGLQIWEDTEGSEGSKAPVFHYWSGTLSPASARSVTALYIVLQRSRWTSIWRGSVASDTCFSSKLIFLEHLNWFFPCITAVWDFSEQNIQPILPTQNTKPPSGEGVCFAVSACYSVCPQYKPQLGH